MKHLFLAVLAVALLVGGAYAANFTVNFTPSEITMTVGESQEVTISSTPEIYYYDHPYEWKCDDTSVASPDVCLYNSCKVYANAVGETTLRYKVHKLLEDIDGEGSCKVIVKAAGDDTSNGNNNNNNGGTSSPSGGGGGCNIGLFGLIGLALIPALKR